jgi:hypothetical protein
MTTREDILNELREITVVADQLSPKTPYEVPQGYFDDLAASILIRIKAEEASTPDAELRVLSPLLAQLDKRMPFTVPENYFNTLSSPVIPQAEKAVSGKVISVSFTKRILRYGIAAAVAGIIAVSTWFLIKTPDAAISQASVAQEVQKMSDAEMNDYIEGNSVASVYQNTPATSEITPEDVKYMLADISDEELQHYVEQDNAAIQVLN